MIKLRRKLDFKSFRSIKRWLQSKTKRSTLTIIDKIE